jgi:hypothetical protein
MKNWIRYMVEIYSNAVSGIIRQLLITQIVAVMSELDFRFGFGLYMISCIIMRDSSQKVYHGLAAKRKHQDRSGLYFIQPMIFTQFMHPYYYIISFLAKNVEAHLVKSYELERRVWPQPFAIVGRLHPDFPKNCIKTRRLSSRTL